MDHNHVIKIFSCRGSQYLAEKIAKYLKLDLGKSIVNVFSDGEFQPAFDESVRGATVFIVQSTFPPVENLFVKGESFMIRFKETKTGLDIEYSKGDTFAIDFEADESIPKGSSLRLQISPNGNVNDIIIEKFFDLNENKFSVRLTNAEIDVLSIDEVYQYRFTFLDVGGNKITNISGNLIVKWGA